jgi:hypothetical protein
LKYLTRWSKIYMYVCIAKIEIWSWFLSGVNVMILKIFSPKKFGEQIDVTWLQTLLCN